ncbi:MAG: rhodanese-like domain-containing protein, partial [Acidimicrobiales bacterium]
PGAFHVELGSLAGEVGRLADEPLLTMCQHGERAATAASILEATGRTDVAIFDGGPDDL